MNKEPGHSCKSCGYLLDDEASEVFQNLPQLEGAVPKDVKMSLVYIAGYIVRKDIHSDECDDTKNYVHTYGDYLNEMNRGCLCIPSDNICQWVMFSYILFDEIADKVCRKSLCNALMFISEYYSVNVEKHHGQIMSNILLKNHCQLFTPRSSKEYKQKILKLSA